MVGQVELVVEKLPYRCCWCAIKYTTSEQAKKCIEIHESACKKIMPKYRIGGHVITRRFGMLSYSTERTMIIDIKGEVFRSELLVENESRERYWIKAIFYQTLDLQENPCAVNVQVSIAD